jgi:hypothetical protein
MMERLCHITPVTDLKRPNTGKGDGGSGGGGGSGDDGGGGDVDVDIPLLQLIHCLKSVQPLFWLFCCLMSTCDRRF